MFRKKKLKAELETVEAMLEVANVRLDKAAREIRNKDDVIAALRLELWAAQKELECTAEGEAVRLEAVYERWPRVKARHAVREGTNYGVSA